MSFMLNCELQIAAECIMRGLRLLLLYYDSPQTHTIIQQQV